MKKSEQVRINEEVENALHDLVVCIDHFGSRKIGKLRSCHATVFETYGYTYLQSYNTLVACIAHEDNTCYDFLRLRYGYTATTAQHISKFMTDYHATALKRYYPV